MYEVPCLKEDNERYYLLVYGSYVITENWRTVIVSNRSVTIIFNYPVNITTHPIQQKEFGEYYTTLIELIIGVPVNITAFGLVLNTDSSLTIIDPIGTLVMVPNSAQVTPIT